MVNMYNLEWIPASARMTDILFFLDLLECYQITWECYMSQQIMQLSEQLGQALLAKQYKLTTAESCTGGWVSQAITAIAGSSQWFDCGFVTYSNASKHTQLGVSEQLLQQYGAVSEAVVAAMAEGALQHSKANISVAITGIAGPDGGSAEKPIGTVCFAWASRQKATHIETQHFNGDRQSIREQAVAYCLRGLLAFLPKV